MKLPPAITDDVQHAMDILKADNKPVWKIAAAAMLRNIADQIDARAKAEIESERAEELRKEAELSKP